MNKKFENILEAIYEKDQRYKPDAYEFALEALSFTQKKLRRLKHVTGTELLEGVKELLMERYGPLALSVLRHWGIETTEDFGHIVFNLVGNKILSKSEEDNIESFRQGYDLEEVFQRGYRKRLEKRISRMRAF